MRNAKDLGWRPRWSDPFGPPDAANMRDFERAFNLRLPKEYREFLKECNGGRLQARYVNADGRTLCEINDLFGLGSRKRDDLARGKSSWDQLNLWGEVRVFRRALGEQCLPIAKDGGGNLIYLDLTTDPASVWRYVVSEQERYRLAPSFEAFLDMLSTELLG